MFFHRNYSNDLRKASMRKSSIPFLDQVSIEPYQTPGDRMPDNFVLLVSALDKGWQIDEPVYIQLHRTQVVPEKYLFFLQRGSDRSLQLVTVQASPDIEAFINSAELQVQVHLDGLLDVCPYAPSNWVQ
jgi:hypothetical protein